MTSTTDADGTVTSTDYSTAWRETVTDAEGNKQRSYFDAFDRLSKVEELDASHAVYATTNYAYDVLGNITQITDTNGNTGTMSYDWLSRKTAMSDPDMGSWTYAYDNNGNIVSQTDAKGQTITLAYDALDRLMGRTYPAGSGMTNVVYAYDSTSGGNYGKSRKTGMTDASGATAWKYDTRGRVVQETRTVASVDYTTAYTYDANGNMTTRGSQTLTWDVENRLVGVTGGVTMSAVYDGEGNRVKKNEGGETVVYVNQYYEKNLTTGVVTTHYYLGSSEVAYRKGTTLEYVCQDHLSSTALTTDASGNTVGTIKYFAFGYTRGTSGTLGTDKLYTGQRLDNTGLYFYNARYYDAAIGRFISADTLVPNWSNPQSLNRYSYCWNNPLGVTDPSGHWGWSNICKAASSVGRAVGGAAKSVARTTASVTRTVGRTVSNNIGYIQTGLDIAGMLPVVGEAFDAINGGIYALRGDYLNAGLSFAACLPFIGSAATVGKFVNKVDNVVDAAKTIRNVEKATDVASSFKSQPVAQVLKKDTVVYHYFGARTEPTSPWVTTKQYKKSGNARRYLALPKKNAATKVSITTLPAGTTVLTGKAASMVGNPVFGSYATGGGYQMYIPDFSSLNLTFTISIPGIF